jgi:hypothetical protein
MNKICRENGYQVKLVVSGGAAGADTFGEQFARLRNIPVKVFRPDWNREGKKAGFLRNVDIIKACTVCVAFWDGESHGTRHDIQLCIEQKKDCWVYNIKNNKLFFRAGTEEGDEILKLSVVV